AALSSTGCCVIAMHTRRDDPSIPAWRGDELDSRCPPETGPPYFDDALKAWVLSRHADILAAFRASQLSPVSPASRKTSASSDESARLKMRAEAMAALGPAQLRSFRERLVPEARALASSLPTGVSVDLMDAYARPLCLFLAAMVTGSSRNDAAALCESAQ